MSGATRIAVSATTARSASCGGHRVSPGRYLVPICGPASRRVIPESRELVSDSVSIAVAAVPGSSTSSAITVSVPRYSLSIAPVPITAASRGRSSALVSSRRLTSRSGSGAWGWRSAPQPGARSVLPEAGSVLRRAAARRRCGFFSRRSASAPRPAAALRLGCSAAVELALPRRRGSFVDRRRGSLVDGRRRALLNRWSGRFFDGHLRWLLDRRLRRFLDRDGRWLLPVRGRCGSSFWPRLGGLLRASRGARSVLVAAPRLRVLLDSSGGSFGSRPADAAPDSDASPAQPFALDALDLQLHEVGRRCQRELGPCCRSRGPR